MGRKSRRSKKNGFWGLIGKFFSFLVIGLLKLIPVGLIAAAFLFGVFGVKKILCADTHLQVRAIRVVPAGTLSAQSVKILEDKIIGKNIFSLDLKRIASQIELGPGAQSVRVVRELPATLRIDIKKRKPVANVLFREGGHYGVAAEDGMIIATSATPDPAWVVMEDFSESYTKPSIGARINNKGFFEALRFLDAFNGHELARKEKVTRIELDAYGNVTVRLGEGPDFQLGRQPSEKLSMLTKAMYLFENEPRETVEYMDLQFDRVAMKRKGK